MEAYPHWSMNAKVFSKRTMFSLPTLFVCVLAAVGLCWRWAGPTSPPSESQRSGPSTGRRNPSTWVPMWRVAFKNVLLKTCLYARCKLANTLWVYAHRQYIHYRTNMFRYPRQRASRQRLAKVADSLSVRVARLPLQRLQTQTSDAASGRSAFQLSRRYMSVWVAKRTRQRDGMQKKKTL